MKEESSGNSESDTMKQLQDKIASLSQSEFARSKDVLAMIWSGVMGPLDSPAPKPVSTFPTNIPVLPNWHRIELALLKSIHTGIFIDVQFYAYNGIDHDMPLDPKPLFTSSIVIEEWGSAIATRKL